jgi:hypothetical protein
MEEVDGCMNVEYLSACVHGEHGNNVERTPTMTNFLT